MNLLVNPTSDVNNTQTEYKFAVHLDGHGYLTNETNWGDRLEMGENLQTFDFRHEGDASRFDEPPVDLLDRAGYLRPGMAIHRLTIITHVEEMVFA